MFLVFIGVFPEVLICVGYSSPFEKLQVSQISAKCCPFFTENVLKRALLRHFGGPLSLNYWKETEKIMDFRYWNPA